MSEPKDYLSHFEEIALLAVLLLSENAYGAKIRQTVSETMGRDVSIGSVYVTLDKLERKGYIKSWQGEATPERGGRAKRYYMIMGSGVKVLNDEEAACSRLATGFGLGCNPARSAIISEYCVHIFLLAHSRSSLRHLYG